MAVPCLGDNKRRREAFVHFFFARFCGESLYHDDIYSDSKQPIRPCYVKPERFEMHHSVRALEVVILYANSVEFEFWKCTGREKKSYVSWWLGQILEKVQRERFDV